jgi:cytochrome-b5 reductase
MDEFEPLSNEMINDGSSAEVMLLPPKPIEPLDSECCGTGCSPCVFDIYRKQLKRWEKECEELRLNGRRSMNPHPDDVDSFLSQEKYHSFTVDYITTETTNSKIYTFKRTAENSERFSWSSRMFPVKLGQHVLVRMNNISKQYTVLRLNKDAKDGTFDILIKMYPTGQLTPCIDTLSVGSTIKMRGPFGKPLEYKRNSMKEIMMLVAGTGISPMYRIIQQVLEDEEDETRVKLLFACKSVDEIPLTCELKNWSSFWNFDVIYFVTAKDESAAVHENKPYYGAKLKYQRICKDVLEEQFSKTCDSFSKTLFLICGTKSFEKDMINHLSKLGIDLATRVVIF